MTQQPPQEAPQVIAWRPVSSLRFDPQNPRIVVNPGTTQEEILRVLFEEGLDDLAISLTASGYFPEEPLVIVPREDEEGAFTVVEGNRRVAALKILLEPKLRSRVGATDWPHLTAEREASLQTVPTILYKTREEIVPYLGFRHITGIRAWGPFAKARYVTALIDLGQRIERVEDLVGDSARTVKKLYQTFVVYRQIESDLDMEMKGIRDSFSLLEVAISQQPIKRFLGIPRELPSKIVAEIVPDDKLANLRELVSYVFGDPDHGLTKIISDSRQIPQRLAPILASEQALDYLRKTRDLEGAYEYSEGERQYLLKQVASARRSAMRALGLLPLYKNDVTIRDEIRRLAEVVRSLDKEVESWATA